MTYKVKISESNTDKVRISLDENNNRKHRSTYSEHNTNLDMEEACQTISENINEIKYNNSSKHISLLQYENEVNVENLERESNMQKKNKHSIASN